MSGRGTRGRPKGSTAYAIQQAHAMQAQAQSQYQQQQQQQQAAAQAIQQQQALFAMHQQQEPINASAPAPASGDHPNKYKKPTDKRLSPLFDEVLPSAHLYRSLQEIERKIDATIYRKKLDLQDLYARSVRTRETMRIFISNTVSEQPWQVMPDNPFDFDNSSLVPSFNLRIEGRMLNDKEPLDSPNRRPFSSYFTSIAVKFDSLEDPTESLTAVWHEVTSPHERAALISAHQEQRLEFDVLEVRRKGSQPVQATIMLQLKEFPDKYKLSPDLANLLAIDEEKTPGVVLALWQYIKFHKLQSPDDSKLIYCDAPLRKLFNKEAFTFPEILDLLKPHLLARSPITIPYTVQMSKPNNIGEFAVDIEIEKDHPIKDEMADLLEHWNDNYEEIQAIDDQIALTIQDMNATRLKYEFMKSMAENPSGTVSQWLDSQASDLRLIMNEKGFNEEQVRRSEFYDDEMLNQTLHLILNGKR